MPVSTRRSLAAQTDGSSESPSGQPDITTIMNDLAGHISQTPSRKHPRSSGDSEPISRPSKKTLAVDLRHPETTNSTPSGPSPRRASGRLKARLSLPATTPAGKQGNWRLDDNDAGEEAGGALILKKRRPLAKRKSLDRSPFKGKGTLQINSSARVHLDDSPAKLTQAQKLDKISKSLLKQTRPAQKPLKRVKNTNKPASVAARTLGRPALVSGNPFEDAAEDKEGPLTPGFGLGSKDQPPPRRSQNEFSPRKADRKASRKVVTIEQQQAPPSGQGDNRAPTDEPSDPPPQTQNSKVPNLIPTRREEAPDDEHDEAEGVEQSDGIEDAEWIAPSADGDQHYGSQEPEEHYADISLPPPQPASRPDTEAEKRARETAEAEEIEKNRLARRKALRGIRKALEFSDLTEPWVELLIGVAKIEEVRSSAEEESTKGKAVQRQIKRIHEAYGKLKEGSASSSLGVDEMIAKNMQVLKNRCAHIDQYKMESQPRTHERGKMIRDVYQHLIPSVVRLAKEVLKVRYVDNNLSFGAHKELVRVLKIAVDLVATARQWQPRPHLENQIKSILIDSVPLNLDRIISKYDAVIVNEEEAEFRQGLALKQIADQEELLAAKQKKDAEFKAMQRRQREQYYKGSRPHQQWPTSKDVLDIDDIADPVTSIRPEMRLSQQSRSRARRQTSPPEEILAPPRSEWTEEQDIVLLEALQQFTDASRFEDILEHYGAPRGKLRNFDMDQIMVRTRYIKQISIAGLKELGLLGPEWSWLTTCP